jgi:hypothetical protein
MGGPKMHFSLARVLELRLFLYDVFAQFATFFRGLAHSMPRNALRIIHIGC